MGRYLDIPHQIYDYAFAIFLVSWFITRHVLFLMVMWSTWSIDKIIELKWAPEEGHFLTMNFYWAFNGALAALQVSILLVDLLGMPCLFLYRCYNASGSTSSCGSHSVWYSTERLPLTTAATRKSRFSAAHQRVDGSLHPPSALVDEKDEKKAQ